MSVPSARLSIQAISPAYWRVTIGNPPINLYDPEMFAELRVLYERAEADPALKGIVFDSADPDYFIAQYDTALGGEIPDTPSGSVHRVAGFGVANGGQSFAPSTTDDVGAGCTSDGCAAPTTT